MGRKQSTKPLSREISMASQYWSGSATGVACGANGADTALDAIRNGRWCKIMPQWCNGVGIDATAELAE